MNKNNDISALFEQFQGDAGAYREFVQEAQTEDARARWPLISTISATIFQVPPACSNTNIGVQINPIVAHSIEPIPVRLVCAAAETAVAPVHRISLFSGLLRLIAGSGRRVRA